MAKSNVASKVRKIRRGPSAESWRPRTQRLQVHGDAIPGFSHELNNLIMIVNTSAELLLDDPKSSDEVRQSAASILDAGVRANATLRDLFDFVGPQNSVHRTPTDRAIANCSSILRRLVRERVELTLALAGEDSSVLIAPALLEAVLMGLVLHARDASREGGQIRIETRPVHLKCPLERSGSTVDRGSYVLLLVHAGRPEDVEPKETRAKVLSFPGNPSRAHLSAIRDVVERAGGHLLVDGVAEASTFVLYLPCAPPSSPPHHHQGQRDERSQTAFPATEVAESERTAIHGDNAS